MLRRILPLLAAIAVAAACAGADKQPEPTPTKEPFIDSTPQAVATATGALKDALLDPEDLGEGWSEQEVGDATVADQYYCGVKVTLPPSDATAIFVNSDGRGLFQGIVVLPDDASAAAVIATVRDAQDGCDDYISTDGVRRTDWHTESFRDIQLGDEATLEVASTESFGAAPATSYAVTFRKGRALNIVVLFGESADSERQITDIAALALDEYERASEN